MQDTILYLVPALAVVGLIYMFVQSRWVRSQDTGEEKMSTIAKHIHEGIQCIPLRPLLCQLR